MKKISNEYQNKAIELLAQGGQTYIEIAEECGISVDTLRNWRKEPEFQDAVKSTITTQVAAEAIESLGIGVL